MGVFQPPKDGSILIIDDKVEEALPLLKLLSQGGVACTYYSGTRDSELPAGPVQKIRLAFVDIQLFPASDANTYAQNVLRLLDKIIADDNGPYILVVWSKYEEDYADELERQITAPDFSKRPVVFSRLHKNDYFQARTDDSLGDILEDVYSSLGTRFGEEDLRAIKSVIDEKRPIATTWEAKDNALELIYAALQSKLGEADTLQLFIIWENLINKASGKVVGSFSALYPTDDYWRDNLKSGIYRLAHAQLGKTIDSADEDDLIRNALKTINQSFLDVVEGYINDTQNLSAIIKLDRNTISFTQRLGDDEYKIIKKTKTARYQLLINGVKMPSGQPKDTSNIEKLKECGSNSAQNMNIKALIKEFKSITPEINTRLLIDFPKSRTIQPGNIYQKEGIHWNRKRSLLRSYYDPEAAIFKKDARGNYQVAYSVIKTFIFIELEITPLCDYTERKWKKSRLLPGVLIPEQYTSEISKSDSIYRNIPIIKINNKGYKPVFNFHLLKSIDIEEDPNKLRIPICRAKRELCADIQSRLSSHASRVGIAYVE